MFSFVPERWFLYYWLRHAGFSWGEGGVDHSLKERIGFAVITLGIYTLLCVFLPKYL